MIDRFWFNFCTDTTFSNAILGNLTVGRHAILFAFSCMGRCEAENYIDIYAKDELLLTIRNVGIYGYSIYCSVLDLVYSRGENYKHYMKQFYQNKD